ncbi:Signal transduction histidine kinase [Nocardioides exalbidus]|uniref:Sensor-like histidine kinase SenX3 n=1 Tax=Nocardioides exalbidus TaxID=402596 RepID=A0A1H4R4G6_9ACTN|nr:ATP-binding protein [Nocardioides exalbidus]SEC26708.1 Signal transduction histidine kinase [Nocardioides exalbidus]
MTALHPRGPSLGVHDPSGPDGAAPATPRTTLPLLAVASFAVAYGVLTVVGRMTIVHGQSVSLVWPAAGVATMWLLTESPRHQWRVLAPLALVHALILGLTNAAPLLMVLGALSIVVQTWVIVLLVRTWCPEMLGAGGSRSLRSPRTLAVATGAVVVGCVVGAGIGTVALWSSDASVDAWTFVAWFARHVTGVLAVGGVGHLAWEWLTQPIPQRAQGGHRRELAALWLVSVVVTFVIFLQSLPLAYLVVTFSVWSAARFRTFPAAVHCLVLGSIGLWLTLMGFGPFARAEPLEAALVSQVFVVVVLLTGLAVGALGDRIDALYLSATRSQEASSQQAHLLAEMTESMNEGLVVLAGDGSVDRSNGASRMLAHRVLPGAPDVVALAELVELVLRPDPANTGAARPELGVGDVVLILPRGEEMVLAVTRTPLAGGGDDGASSAALLVLREVTDHRSGLRPLATFASTAAHDLRGPLSATVSWLDMAIADTHPGAEALDALTRASRSAEQMGDLIDDLLAHAQAESGELAAEDVPLSGDDGLLAQAATLLGPDDSIEVPDDLPAVHADPVAVRQLFANLVGNAVKYAKPGAPARVAVTAHRHGARVVVEISDDGVGVEDEERALIFQRFHRSNSVRAHFRGTGMGLSICQTIVTRHGGTIECLATPPGGGSVFRFDLPAAD